MNVCGVCVQEVRPLCSVADERSAFISEVDTFWSAYNIVDVRSLLSDMSSEDAPVHGSLADHELLNRRPDLLAVIYTSGSTGVPKGVQITHRMLMNRVLWQWHRFPFRHDDVGCLKTSPLFVDSIVEMFSCLLHPINLVISPAAITSNVDEFLDFLQRHRITRLTLVASLLHGILSFLSTTSESARFPLRQLELWISNSEPLSTSNARRFFATFPLHKTLCNFYGGTETMADVTFDVFSGVEDVERKCVDDALSIGCPVWNTIVYVVDSEGQLCKQGDVGEICVSGLNVTSRGYVAEDSNCQHFVNNSFLEETPFYNSVEIQNHHMKLYRTGDYGRVVDGRLIYDGRHDSQVNDATALIASIYAVVIFSCEE